MPDIENDPRREVALFRYGVIAELLCLPAGSPERWAAMRAKAALAHAIPGSYRTRVAVETMRDWIAHYERGGFEALYPKLRADRGRTRQLPPAVAELLVGIKERQPHLSVREVILQARASVPREVLLAPSSVNRLLHREGLMERADEQPEPKDRRRFAYRLASELWMSDVMHGPPVGSDSGDRRRRAKSYLIAFIDDATRLVPHAAFTLSENAATFLPVFKQALLKRGLPTRLYVDNGSNYRCQHLAVICATLGINLIHATAYQPQGKGKIERFFRTCRAQLLPALGVDDTRSLDALNARLAAWIEGEYHLSPHRGLDGRTPLESWSRSASSVRLVGPETDLDTLFRFRLKRRVSKDRTVSLLGTLYEVDAALVGENILLLHDPSVPRSRPIPVLHAGRQAGQATLLDAYANTRVKRTRATNRPDQAVDPAPAPQPSPLRLRALRAPCQEHD